MIALMIYAVQPPVPLFFTIIVAISVIERRFTCPKWAFLLRMSSDNLINDGNFR